MYLLCFLLPILLLVIGFMFQHVFPFGDNTLIRNDFNNQYISYFVYFKEHFSNFHSFIYSNEMALGGNMIGLTAYYLMSPLNIIILLFSVKNISIAIMIITLLKIGLIGFTTSIFFKYFMEKYDYRLNIDKNLFILVLSISYALCAYAMSYMLNIMWLDDIYALPIVILGIERIIDRKSSIVYILSLAYSVVVNYYIGYMICIFSGLYMIYRLLEQRIYKKKIPFKQVIDYVFGSIVGVGLSSFILLPALLSLSGVKSTQYYFTLTPSYNFFHFFEQLLNGALKYNTTRYLVAAPMIYSGLLVLVVLIYYLLNKFVPLKQKILDFAFIFVLFLSSYISGIDKIWHGFNAPEGVPNRYAFIFSFLFLYMAAKSTRYKENNYFAKTLIVSLLFIGSIALMAEKDSAHLPWKLALYNISALTILAIFYYFMRKGNKYLKYIFILVGFIDIGVGTVHTQLISSPGASNSSFVNYYNTTSKIFESIKNKNDFRIGSTFSRSANDPMLLNYNGISHYSSSQPMKDMSYLASLGYYQLFSWAHWTNYNSGSTLAVDALLGVKYVVDNRSLSFMKTIENNKLAMSTYSNNGDLSGLTLINRTNNFKIYKNNLAFKLAFTTNKIVHGNQIKYNPEYNEFDNMNSIFHNFTNKNVYRKDSMQVKSKKSKIFYNITAKETGILYMQIPSSMAQQPYLNQNKDGLFTIKVNGKGFGNISNESENGIIKIGSFSKGDKVSVELAGNLGSYGKLIEKSPNFFSENEELIKQFSNHQENQKLVTISHGDRIVTEGKTNDKYIVYSLPFDNNWKAKINGKSIKVEKAFGNLIAVPIHSRENRIKIELNYIPKGVKTGIVVSSVSVFLLLISIMFERNKKRV